MLLVQDIYNTSIAQFIQNQKNNLLPDIFKNYFRPIPEIHCHNTRHSNKLFLDRKRTEQGKLQRHINLEQFTKHNHCHRKDCIILRDRPNKLTSTNCRHSS